MFIFFEFIFFLQIMQDICDDLLAIFSPFLNVKGAAQMDSPFYLMFRRYVQLQVQLAQSELNVVE